MHGTCVPMYTTALKSVKGVQNQDYKVTKSLNKLYYIVLAMLPISCIFIMFSRECRGSRRIVLNRAVTFRK